MVLNSVVASLAAIGSTQAQSICGQDERQPSFARGVGVVERKDPEKNPGFCTITLIDDACALTAGHCLHVLERATFYLDNEENQMSKAESYEVDKASIRALQTRIGNDWAVVRLKPNSTTSLLPGKVHGFVEPQITPVELPAGEIEVHAVERKVAKTFERYSARGQILATDNSILFHDLDTVPGGSGALIVDPANGKAFAIHTHGGCETMKNNKGTIIARVPFLVRAIKECRQMSQ
ncbi:MAG: hypothetical protein RI953_260 [Pseudomonadota bacterium]|jgi:V8-like Glu-specific endopeptidase